MSDRNDVVHILRKKYQDTRSLYVFITLIHFTFVTTLLSFIFYTFVCVYCSCSAYIISDIFQILATSRASKIPFPSLPTETIVHEYISLRKCDGVTIGWYAAPTNGNNNYCIAAKRGKLPENLTHKAPDNCKIDYEMRSLMNVSYCKRFNEKSG